MEVLDNTDNSLLSKINNLEKDNAQSLTDFKKDLDNKLTEHEKDVDGKLQVVNDKANSLVIKLNSLDTDNKNNSQTIVNLQESIYLQTEQVKKVDAERQQAEAKAKEDFETTVATNAKAIDALKAEVEESITKLEITFKQEQSKDNSALIDRLNIVQDTTTSNETRIGSLEKAVPEATKNLVLEIDAKLKGYDESASQKIREAEDNIQKNAQDIASQSNLLKEHTENINNFISSNEAFNNQFIAIETKSEDFLKYLQVERQRIDNVESELNNLDKSVQKAQSIDLAASTDNADLNEPLSAKPTHNQTFGNKAGCDVFHSEDQNREMFVCNQCSECFASQKQVLEHLAQLACFTPVCPHCNVDFSGLVSNKIECLKHFENSNKNISEKNL